MKTHSWRVPKWMQIPVVQHIETKAGVKGNMTYGVIYIAHNPRDGGSTFKVGKTERIVEERMKELTSSTSNLGTYRARAYFVVYDIDVAERACHRALHRYRVQDNREFFEIPLPRLIRIVTEQVQPYTARSFVEEQEVENSSPKQIDALELLRTARVHRSNIDQLWDDALASAKATSSQWVSLIRQKVLHTSEKLRSESTLKWDIPSGANNEPNPPHSITICSVTVVSLFSKDPLVLRHSAIRGGSSKNLDLSRAIGEPAVHNLDLATVTEFVSWEEKDDGRVGRIDLLCEIAYAMPQHRERGIAPTPRLVVRATPLKYNDYSRNFETTYHQSKSYSNPEEAFEVFLALIVENIKVPQYDVRQQSGNFRKGRGPRISDQGRFDMRHLEN